MLSLDRTEYAFFTDSFVFGCIYVTMMKIKDQSLLRPGKGPEDVSIDNEKLFITPLICH